jgi:hypothetical protein
MGCTPATSVCLLQVDTESRKLPAAEPVSSAPDKAVIGPAQLPKAAPLPQSGKDDTKVTAVDARPPLGLETSKGDSGPSSGPAGHTKQGCCCVVM